jgi:hypothetical protein
VLWRTCWGTHWEPGKNEKKKKPSPLKKIKRKKSKALGLHAWGLPIGCMKFLFSKEFVTIFGLG